MKFMAGRIIELCDIQVAVTETVLLTSLVNK
jgi:hypothetical protein